MKPTLFKNLPYPLLVVLSVFVVVPPSSLLFVGSPWGGGGFDNALLVLFAYWITPLLISYFALKRHYLLLPLFFIECSLLLLHSVSPGVGVEMDVGLVRYFLLTAMVLFSVTFFNRDTLYPMLAAPGRGWRRTPRIELHAPVRLWYRGGTGAQIMATVRNVSLSGFSLRGDPEILKSFLAHKDELASFILYMGFRKHEWMLNVRLVRMRLDDDGLHVGFESLNRTAMREMLDELADHGMVQVGWFSRYWAREGFHHATLLACAMSLAVVFINPSCSKSGASAKVDRAPEARLWVPQK